MNDLLSELDCIGGEGPSCKKQDGSSSPLRPNPKYCQPRQSPPRHEHPRGPRRKPENHSPRDLVCIDEEVRPLHIKQDGSSSPLRPNPKYCQPRQSPPRQEYKKAPIWKPQDEDSRRVSYHYSSPAASKPRRPSPPQRRPSPPPQRVRDTIQNIMGPSNRQHQPLATVPPPLSSRLPETIQKIINATKMEMEVDDVSDRSSSPIKLNEKYCPIIAPSAPRVARVAPLSVQPPKEVQGQAKHGWIRKDGEWVWDDGAPSATTYSTPQQHSNYSTPTTMDYSTPRPADFSLTRGPGTRPNLVDQSPRDGYPEDYSRDRMDTEQEVRNSNYVPLGSRARAIDEWEQRREEDARNRIEEERRRKLRAEEEHKLNSYVEARPQQREGTISLTRTELEAIKAQCKAEGEKKALAEARKAEAVARLNRCLGRIEAKSQEPEPMDVEESDTVESSIPSSSSNSIIAPIPVHIKAEPPEALETTKKEAPSEEDVTKEMEGRDKKKKEEVVEKEEEKNEEGKREEEKEKEKEVDDAIQIIEKSPAEIVTLSDDEGTVAGSTVSSVQDVKQEEQPSREPDEDLWVIGARRRRKKGHAFDLRKVKKEKEKEEEHDKPSSSSKSASPFIPPKVKTEPAEKGTKSIKKEPQSAKVKDEVVACTEEAVTVPEPAANKDESSLPVQQVREPSGEQQPELSGADMSAALAAARRLIRQIDETVQSTRQQQQQPRRPRRHPRNVHQPAPGSFMHSLRTVSRKRSEWCDRDGDEEDYLRSEGSCERHEWGAKRGKIEEDEEEESRSQED